ncbi:MAG: hypothetical protein WKF73_11305 [Nocardioidaceae bacterium]
MTVSVHVSIANWRRAVNRLPERVVGLRLALILRLVLAVAAARSP